VSGRAGHGTGLTIGPVEARAGDDDRQLTTEPSIDPREALDSDTPAE
jgi:hypothetical protein